MPSWFRAGPGRSCLGVALFRRAGLLERAEEKHQVRPCRDRLEGRTVHGSEGRRGRLIKPAELVGLLGGQLTGGTVGRPQQRLVPGRGAAPEPPDVVDP